MGTHPCLRERIEPVLRPKRRADRLVRPAISDPSPAFPQRVLTRKRAHRRCDANANLNEGRAMRSPPIPQMELHRFSGQGYGRFGFVRALHLASLRPEPLKQT